MGKEGGAVPAPPAAPSGSRGLRGPPAGVPTAGGALPLTHEGYASLSSRRATHCPRELSGFVPREGRGPGGGGTACLCYLFPFLVRFSLVLISTYDPVSSELNFSKVDGFGFLNAREIEMGLPGRVSSRSGSPAWAAEWAREAVAPSRVRPGQVPLSAPRAQEPLAAGQLLPEPLPPAHL